MISIIMAVYNESEKDIRESLLSISEQSFKNYEFIIVVDDNHNTSILNQLKLAAERDTRIKIFVNEQNLGLGNSLNKAISVAHGELIVRMDADDVAFPNRLQTLVDNVQPNDDLVFSRYEIIDQDDHHVKYSGHMNYSDQQISKKMKLNNFICHPSVMFRKDSVLSVGGYSDIRVSEDVDLWIRMLKSGMHFHGIDDILMQYRIRENSMTTSNFLRTHYAKYFIRSSYVNWNGVFKTTNADFQKSFARCDIDPRHYNKDAKELEKVIHDKMTVRGMIQIIHIALRNRLLFLVTKDRVLSKLIRPK